MAPCALSFFLGPEWGLPSPEPPRTRGAAAPHTPGSGRAHFHGGGQGAVAPPWCLQINLDLLRLADGPRDVWHTSHKQHVQIQKSSVPPTLSPKPTTLNSHAPEPRCQQVKGPRHPSIHNEVYRAKTETQGQAHKPEGPKQEQHKPHPERGRVQILPPPDPSTLLPSTPPTPRYPVNHTRHSVAHPMTPTQSPNQCAQVRITIECTKLTTTIKSGRVYCESKNPERKTQPCLTRSHSVRSETLLGRTRIPTPTLSDEIQQKTTEKQKVNMDLTFASIFDRTSKGSKGQRIDER